MDEKSCNPNSLPDLANFQQLIQEEYSALAFSNLFDLVTVSKYGITLKPLTKIKPAALRAVASLQWSKTPNSAKLTIKMHNKIPTLKLLAAFAASKSDSSQITALHLLELPPQKLASLIADIKILE